MLNSEEPQQNTEQQDLFVSDVRSTQPPAQTGTLSANEAEDGSTNQIHTPTAINPGGQGSQITPGAVVDSTTLIGSQQQDEDTPALPPRPSPPTTGGETMPDHAVDELAPPTTDVLEPQHPNPSVVQLQGMFPDFDELVMYVLAFICCCY